MITATEIDFLRESNNIEDEWDDNSLEDAILAWMWIKPKKKLTKNLILEVHQILMDSRTTIEQKDKGAFRDRPVYIGGHEGKPWHVLPELISKWLKQMNDNSIPTYQNAILARDLHVLYESIHPFVDGNGRTGRIFYNWQRLKMGLPIDIIREKEKQKYYAWFNKKENNWVEEIQKAFNDNLDKKIEVA